MVRYSTGLGRMTDFETRPLSNDRKKSILERTEYGENSPVSLDKIVAVHVKHWTFENAIEKGEINIHESLAGHLITIFLQLFEMKFPVHSVVPVDEFDGDDVASMEANNSSAFNPRKVMNTDRWSSHAYGMAIDVNPRQNPYVLNPGTDHEAIYPKGGQECLDRKALKPGMVEPIVGIFSRNGFDDWGGSWQSPLDYHHFQVRWERIRSFF